MITNSNIYSNYPRKRFGVYECCACCHNGEREINGLLERHQVDCSWRVEQENKRIVASKEVPKQEVPHGKRIGFVLTDETQIKVFKEMLARNKDLTISQLAAKFFDAGMRQEAKKLTNSILNKKRNILIYADLHRTNPDSKFYGMWDCPNLGSKRINTPIDLNTLNISPALTAEFRSWISSYEENQYRWYAFDFELHNQTGKDLARKLKVEMPHCYIGYVAQYRYGIAWEQTVEM